MNFYPMIEWNDEASLEEKVHAIYNILNGNSREMYIGRVPKNKEELQNNIDRANVPLSIAFVKMAEKGDIDEVTAYEHIEMFLAWDDKSTFDVGNLRTRTFEGEGTKLYQCMQAHKGQVGWEPENTPALWKEFVMTKDGITIWSQPISQLDAFMLDDETSHNAQIWVSDCDYNVWEPGVFGWHIKEVVE